MVRSRVAPYRSLVETRRNSQNYLGQKLILCTDTKFRLDYSPFLVPGNSLTEIGVTLMTLWVQKFMPRASSEETRTAAIAAPRGLYKFCTRIKILTHVSSISVRKGARESVSLFSYHFWCLTLTCISPPPPPLSLSPRARCSLWTKIVETAP